MPAIRNILVPIDFSPHADRALDYALDLAKAFGARIHLLHAFHHPEYFAAPGAPGAVAIPVDWISSVRERARQELEKRAKRLTQSGAQAQARLEEGPPAQCICDVAGELPADLIVMGTRGRSGLAHILLGSVAERTVRMAPCPVLTLKETAS
jgi:nucleotide-binding universal stress UspA family protein